MAQQFLDRLPRVQDGKLPAGAECMICRERYGTFPSDNGIVEHAVLLPCCHHVGSECIAIWLSPETRLGDSCPLCRTVLLHHQTADYDDEDEDDEDDDEEDGGNDEGDEEGGQNESSDHDEEDEEDSDEGGEGGVGPEEAEDSMNGSEQAPMTVRSAFQLSTYSYFNHSPGDKQDGWDGQEWFERWGIPTRQQYADSEKRARQTLSNPHPSGLLQRSSRTYSPPADFDRRVRELASAYRTMAFRETLLYLNLEEAGARIRPLESPHKGLSAHHEAMLLWELGQRGAFKETQVRPGHMAMTNRQSWYVHRAKGEVYTYERSPAIGRGYWSTDLGFEEGAQEDVEVME